MTPACGKRIPASEHAVSLSLPTLRDVIGYEERSDDVFRHVCSGYPRFVRHWTVEKVQAMLREDRGGRAGAVVALHDPAACGRLMAFLGRDLEVLDDLPFGAVVLPDGDAAVAEKTRCFLQHTGLMLSSRQSEDYLLERGVVAACQAEAHSGSADPGGEIRGALAGMYGVRDDRIRLYPSGMNALFSVFDRINRRQGAAGRDLWLQVGWLYLDTTAVLDRFAARHLHVGAMDMDAVEDCLREHRGRLAGVVTEVMTNPLMHTPDLRRLGEAARRYGVPLIVDVSMPTPVNVEVFPHADVVIESLTKFASGHGDVMAGAAVFNDASEWGACLGESVEEGHPYERDLRRLAHCIRGYAARMRVVNANALALADAFRADRRVRRVHWAGQPESAAAYEAVRRPGGGYGGVVSVVFAKPLAEVYDRLDLLKGPSFGTEFTLCMAYVYMAHYDLVMTAAGRARLREHGLDPELLRISVGTEPVDGTIRAFDRLL